MVELPDAVLFDMDGLLLDSERLYLEAFRAACERRQYVFDEASYLNIICTPDAEAREILLAGYGAAFPVDEVSALAADTYRERIKAEAVPLKKGALELLKFLEERGVPRAVVTSTRTELACHKLRLAGLLNAFSFVVGGDQVKRGKPAPESYLLACAKLEVNPERCWALEDSDNGVRAALAAGLTVIQIPDLKAPSDELLAFGHEVRASLLEVLAGLEAQRG